MDAPAGSTSRPQSERPAPDGLRPRGYLFGLVLLRSIAVVAGVAGLAMTVGGFQLVGLGGSPYYLIAGIALLAAGALLMLRRRWGVWLYGGTLAFTLAWSIYEVGFEWWSLLPRMLALSAIGVPLLLPSVGRALREPPADRFRGRPYAVGLIAAAFATGAGYLLHVGLVAPSLPADPRFQTGFGTFPAAEAAAVSGPAGGASAEWRYFGGDQAGSHFSTLDQVTPRNVSRLERVWSVDVGTTPGMTSTPIQVGGRIYTCDNGNRVFALDAATGKEIWRYDGSKGLDGRCRGVSFFSAPGLEGVCANRILSGMNSNKLIALDARDGRPCPGFGRNGVVDLLRGMGDARGVIIPDYYRLTSAPLIVRGKAVVGGFVSDNQYWGEPSGVVRAFDAVTGKLSWAWDVGRPDRSGEPPANENYTHSTPNSWAPMSTDEEAGLVYLPTGNPAPDLFGGFRRPFDERVGSSVVALDAETGREVWSFQTKHHDLWDRDVPSQPTLTSIPGPDGRVRKALIQATKGGEVFVLDRLTGKPIFPVTERRVSRAGAVPDDRLSPTQPFSDAVPSFRGANLREADMWGITPLDQLFCRVRFRQARYSGPDTPVGLTPSIIYPSMFGATNWGGVSVDPVNHVMIVASNRMASYVRLLRRSEADARGYHPYKGGSQPKVLFGEPMAQTPYGAERSYWLTALGLPCIAPPYGLISAVDLNNGKLLWSRPFGTAKGGGPFGTKFPFALPMGTPNHGGALVTRGGLVFVGGTPDNFLHAFDLRTGSLLWTSELPGGGNAMPITYTVNGRQFIVIAAGGAAPLGARLSTKMVAFALPRSSGQR